MSTNFSDFSHIFAMDVNTYALFNSLWLRVIFFDKDLLSFVIALKEGKESTSGALLRLDENMRQDAQKLLSQMDDQKFLSPHEDEIRLAEIRKAIDELSVTTMYLITTSRCNLACSYCYLANALETGGNDMSIPIAKKAIDMFQNTVKEKQINAPRIILYGGEPLLNKELVKFAVEYATDHIPNCRFTVNTNGTVLDDDILELFFNKNVEVALSIDGPQQIHDTHRISKGGKGTFALVVDNFKKYQQRGINVGISCTITPNNVLGLSETAQWLIDELHIRALGFNLMLGCFSNQEMAEEYSQNAAQALVDSFVILRNAGVYEDRMMRRVRSLVEGVVSVNDCSGSGQQIVVSPAGKIGVCQAFLNTDENFFSMDSIPNPESHDLWKTWRRRSPFNIAECVSCEALGLCGGGCAYNSLIRSGDIMLPDKVHCVHAKKALHFLLSDLLQTVSTQTSVKSNG